MKSHQWTKILWLATLFFIAACGESTQTNQRSVSDSAAEAPDTENAPEGFEDDNPDAISTSFSLNGHDIKPLNLFWQPHRQHNFTSATVVGHRSAFHAGYRFIRTEGCVLKHRRHGTRPLRLYWQPHRQDNFSSGTGVGDDTARHAHYYGVRKQGYIFTNRVAGTVPLYLFWNPYRQDNFSTATRVGIDSAVRSGYYFVRVQGYIFPPGRCR